LIFFDFFKFFKIFLISKKVSTCQVTIVPHVNGSTTCQFVVLLFRFNYAFGPHFGVKISKWYPNF